MQLFLWLYLWREVGAKGRILGEDPSNNGVRASRLAEESVEMFGGKAVFAST